MLYKFKSKDEIQAYRGGFVVLDNRIHTNPSIETLHKVGYKPLVDVEKPDFDAETEYLITTYKDGDVITPVYAVKKISEDVVE